MSENRIKQERTPRSAELITEIIKLYSWGCSHEEIGRRLNVSRNYARGVCNWHKKTGEVPDPSMREATLNGWQKYHDANMAKLRAEREAQAVDRAHGAAKAHPRTAWPDWFESVPESRFMARRA